MKSYIEKVIYYSKNNDKKIKPPKNYFEAITANSKEDLGKFIIYR